MGLFGKKATWPTHGAGTHKMGFGCGRIIEDAHGQATYIPPTGNAESFTVSIADVRTFAVSTGDKALQARLRVLGDGVELADVQVSGVDVMKLQEWFRAHPRFAG